MECGGEWAPWVASWRMEPRPVPLAALSLLECQLYVPSFFPYPILAPAQAAQFLNLWVQKANEPSLARVACYIRPAARHASIKEESCNLGFRAGLWEAYFEDPDRSFNYWMTDSCSKVPRHGKLNSWDCRSARLTTAASGTTTQLENGCFSPESIHILSKFYSKLMSPHVNLPWIICQIVYQFSDIVGVYHVPFQ